MIKTENGTAVLTTRYPETFQKLTRICQEISTGKFELRPYLEEPILKKMLYLEKILDKKVEAQEEFVGLQIEYEACQGIINQVKQMQPTGFWKWPDISKNDVPRLPSVVNGWDKNGCFIADGKNCRLLEDLAIVRRIRKWVPPGRRAEFFYELQIFGKNKKEINEFIQTCERLNELETELSQVSQNRSSFTQDINATFHELQNAG